MITKDLLQSNNLQMLYQIKMECKYRLTNYLIIHLDTIICPLVTH